MAVDSNASNDGFEVVKVKHNGALWLPPELQNKFKIKDGDHFKLTPVSPIKFILEKILILSVVAMLPMGFVMPLAFAQSANEQVAGVVNQITPQPPQQQVVLPQPPNNLPTQYQNLSPGETLIPLSADIAKLPLRIEATYPSGISPIWNVTRVFGSNYFHSESVIDRITTKTFSTGMADTWTVTIGQRYDKPTDQVAKIVIFSNNTQIMPGMIIPILNNEFKVRFVITTAEPVKLPTGEDIARPITSRLDELKSLMLNHEDGTETTERTLTYAANSFRLSILLWIVIGAIVTAGVMIMLHLYRKITSGQFQRNKAPLKARLGTFRGFKNKEGENKK